MLLRSKAGTKREIIIFQYDLLLERGNQFANASSGIRTVEFCAGKNAGFPIFISSILIINNQHKTLFSETLKPETFISKNYLEYKDDLQLFIL